MEFMEQVQRYYGSYEDRPRVADYVYAYLMRDIEQSKLSQLFRYITYSHPVNYGPPDIAAIESAIGWAIKNVKGADIHKPRTTGAVESIDDFEISDEEREENKDRIVSAFREMKNAKGI